MNMTRKPVTSVQTKLVAIRFWPTAANTSGMVNPFFGSAMGISPGVPVRVPAGSPAAFSSGFGVETFLMSASVMETGAAAAAAGVSVAGACAWTVARDATHQTMAHAKKTLFMVRFLKLGQRQSMSAF